jgi:hypothetical protein
MFTVKISMVTIVIEVFMSIDKRSLTMITATSRIDLLLLIRSLLPTLLPTLLRLHLRTLFLTLFWPLL